MDARRGHRLLELRRLAFVLRFGASLVEDVDAWLGSELRLEGRDLLSAVAVAQLRVLAGADDLRRSPGTPNMAKPSQNDDMKCRS